MNRVSVPEARTFIIEVLLSILGGALMGWFVSAARMAKIDEMLVTFLSIVVAAVIPGVALTAAAQRPPTESALEAGKLGEGLKSQVRFWFSFLYVGGFAVVVLCICRAADWTLITPRPDWVPTFVPPGSAWLVFASASLLFFTICRVRHVARAVRDLIDLSTAAHTRAALDRRQQVQAQVEEMIKGLPVSPDRGANVGPRNRR
jgi:hypothetical protein